jgi:hypothetical protein
MIKKEKECEKLEKEIVTLRVEVNKLRQELEKFSSVRKHSQQSKAIQ